MPFWLAEARQASVMTALFRAGDASQAATTAFNSGSLWAYGPKTHPRPKPCVRLYWSSEFVVLPRTPQVVAALRFMVCSGQEFRRTSPECFHAC